MNIVGLCAFYHESACCLLQNGKLVAAAEEERFSRVKHDPRLPVNAYRYCLSKGGLSPADVGCIAYYESPTGKLGRQLWSGLHGAPPGDLSWLDPQQPMRAIRERLGYEGRIVISEHHRSHAASAFLFSGFRDAAILTVDGVGEWATTTYGLGHDATLELFEEVLFPHSLGLLYATITAYLGFRVNDGEYKVMGLAAYGKPRYVDQVRTLVRSEPNGQYRLDMRYFDFLRASSMYSKRLSDLFGAPPRETGTEIEPFHQDVAKSLQVVLEEILLDKVTYLAKSVDSPNLCMAGGVALNCVANGQILREGPFERLFVQPAAGDAGGCLGAAALAHIQLTGKRHTYEPLQHVYLGPSATPDQIAGLLSATGIRAQDYRQRETELLEAVVDRLEQSKVVGWFHGPMEFGPRALGARSILADPRDAQLRERLNLAVKRRQAFRPFAPSVLHQHAAGHFDLDHPSPFMLETCRVTSPLNLGAVTHVDGSTRPQTVDPTHSPRYAALLEAYYRRTGCPILLNTSLNTDGEPIVCTPVDALFCMSSAGLDVLVLEDHIVDHEMLPANWTELLPAWQHESRSAFGSEKSAIGENLYTFV
jgi:carbamoyltransferase